MFKSPKLKWIASLFLLAIIFAVVHGCSSDDGKSGEETGEIINIVPSVPVLP